MAKSKHPTMASGAPRITGQGERQMDGSHSPTFSQPVKRAPLADRHAVPSRSSDSGIEKAMGSLADSTHKC